MVHGGGKLGGKVAIVTGGASGIGQALGEELALRGAEVVLADRQRDLADDAAARIRARGGQATAVALDVRDLAAFQALARDTQSRAGHLDYLFNNAGIAIGGEMSSFTAADWDEIIDVNLRGVVNGIQAAYPLMMAQRTGHIVNTASVAGLIAGAAEGCYATTKHAVVGLTKALRVEAKQHGVRVSALCPGAIRTPLLTGGRFGRLKFGAVPNAEILRMWAWVRPMPPAIFARRALDAVLRNEALIVLPSWWKALWYLERASLTASLELWTVLSGRILAELRAAATKGTPPGAA